MYNSGTANIDEVLRHYQIAAYSGALSSIYGPGSAAFQPQNRHAASANDSRSIGQRFNPMGTQYSLFSPDLPLEQKVTELMGHRVPCFDVGGELRLCLPVLLHSLLHGYSLNDIDAICGKLNIFCSRCTDQQLGHFKELGVLPRNAPGCGLITKTNAERLSNSLPNPLEAARGHTHVQSNTRTTFKVIHRCFGKNRGLFHLDLYVAVTSACVECLQCRLLYTAKAFVSHVHGIVETKVCHWGFDSDNWRGYLHLDESEQHITKDEFKAVKEVYNQRGGMKRCRPISLHELSCKVARSQQLATVKEELSRRAVARHHCRTEAGRRYDHDLQPRFPPNVNAVMVNPPVVPAPVVVPAPLVPAVPVPDRRESISPHLVVDVADPEDEDAMEPTDLSTKRRRKDTAPLKRSESQGSAATCSSSSSSAAPPSPQPSCSSESYSSVKKAILKSYLCEQKLAAESEKAGEEVPTKPEEEGDSKLLNMFRAINVVLLAVPGIPVPINKDNHKGAYANPADEKENVGGGNQEEEGTANETGDEKVVQIPKTLETEPIQKWVKGIQDMLRDCEITYTQQMKEGSHA